MSRHSLPLPQSPEPLRMQYWLSILYIGFFYSLQELYIIFNFILIFMIMGILTTCISKYVPSHLQYMAYFFHETLKITEIRTTRINWTSFN